MIDFIRDLVMEGGVMASSAAHAAQRGTIPAANAAADFARTRNWPLFFIRVAFAPDYRDAPQSSPVFQRAMKLQALREGDKGVDWHPALKVLPGETVLTKKGISAFCETGLENLLHRQLCNTLIVCGISSTMAVEATIRNAHDLGFSTIMLEDACAAADDTAHSQAMKICGVLGRVMTVRELPGIIG